VIAVRNPKAGRRRARAISALVGLVVLAAAVFGAGCGSDWCDDDDDDWHAHRDKTVFIYLNIADPDGDPLSEVTVWVDGTKQTDKSSDEYSELGNQFPPDWRGWEYNSSGGPYFFDVYRCPSYTCRIEIQVSKSGWRSQKTHIVINDYDPDEIYFRQTFVLEPTTDSNAAPMEAAQAPEKTSL